MARLGALLLLVAAVAAALLLLSALPGAQGFYLPGSYPHKYNPSEPLSVSYYSRPFCVPPEGVKDSAENLGELLMGDRIENSPLPLQDVHQRVGRLPLPLRPARSLRATTRPGAPPRPPPPGLGVQSVRSRDDREHWRRRRRQVCLLSSRRRLPRMVGPREKCWEGASLTDRWDPQKIEAWIDIPTGVEC
jgi:hypothetical protein